MSFFWAKFENIHGHTFRFDTRIYFHSSSKPGANDDCIGAVVGMNPGSATGTVGGGLHSSAGDPTLRIIKGGVEDAYMHKYFALPASNKYVQVLNLFYLCDQNLATAITNHKTMPFTPIDQTENGMFPWVWYAWGASNTYLDQFKTRFMYRSRREVYLDSKGSSYLGFPLITTTAKHPLKPYTSITATCWTNSISTGIQRVI